MFVRSTPEEAGISSRDVLGYIKALDRCNLKTHGIIMARGNKIIAEGYYAPYQKDTKHRMYSVSKSFVAIAVGFAEQDGLLSLDDKFMQYFPEYENELTLERYHETTIRDMISMQSCMADNALWWGKPDRAQSYFTVPSNQIAGTNYFYDSAGSFLLGCIVEKLTGMPFMEYLKKKCLDDIGFSKDAYCLKAPGNWSHGDSGVMCTTYDLLLFARFVMNKGTWEGKRYLNEEFMSAAISKQTDNSEKGAPNPYSKHGYGYLIWKMPRDGFAFIGMADQIAICDPKTDFIFVITSENHNSHGGASRLLMYDRLYVDIIEKLADQPLAEDTKALSELNDYLATRKLPYLTGEPTNEALAQKINGVTYALETNPMGISDIKVTLDGDKGTLTYHNEDGENRLHFGFGYNLYDKFPSKKRMSITASVYEDGQYDCGTSAAWLMKDKLQIFSQVIDTYIGNVLITLGFKDDRVSVSMVKYAQRILDHYDGHTVGKKVD